MQFNWIFVIIIGAVLLGFFFTAIMNASKSSDTKISVSLAKHFETIIFSSGQKAGVLKTFQTPPVSLHFTCDDSQGLYNYYVGDLKARDTKYDLLFAPDSLTGKSIMTWTQKWQVPYSVGTFLYITNEETLFIFDDGDHTPNTDTMSTPMKKILADFPTNISTYIINSTNPAPTTDFNFKHYVYVFVIDNDNLFDFPKMIQKTPTSDYTVSAVIIHPHDNSNVFGYGDIFYPDVTHDGFSFDPYILLNYTSGTTLADLPQLNNYALGGSASQHSSSSGSSRTPPDIQSGYLGKASLYGAMFANSKEAYECSMKKAFHKFTLLTILQENKIDSVGPLVSYTCKDNLGLNEGVPGPKQTLEKIQDDIFEDGQVIFNYKILPSIYDLGLQLQRENDNLQMMGNCPVIY